MAKKKRRKSNKTCFTIQLMLATSRNDRRLLAKRFHFAEIIYNQIVRYVKKQYNKLIRDPRYKNAEGSERTAIIEEYNLTKFDLIKYSKIIARKYKKHLDSKVVQCLAKRVYTALDKVLYDNGEYIHFKRFGDLDTIETDTNINKLRFEDNILLFNGYKLKVREKSLNNPYIKEVMDSGIIKYCRIKRLPFNTGYRYYLQLVFDGIPPMKNRNIGNSDVGIDIGTSTIAVSSKDNVTLNELAVKSKDYNSKIIKLNQKLERSRRLSNPGNFNDDGTIKKGRHKWVYSKSYRKVRMQLKALYRKKAAYTKQSHEILANEIISYGNCFYVEYMNFKALQKRSKKTEKNSAGKFKKKKRFGKSLNNRAPSMLISIIERKLKYHGIELKKVDTKSFKASQYNHIEDTYTPKKLYERHAIIDNHWIQRDLYSSFLLMNSNDDLLTTNRNKCLETFDRFLELHNIYIAENRNKKHPECFGF